MCEIESLVEAYLIAERDLVAAADAAGGAVPLPNGRTVTVGRAEFDALLGERRKRAWVPLNRRHPDSIGCLSRLRELNLRNNKLISLPESIGALQELRQINLRGNPLMRLPAAVAALPRLEKLDLRWVPTLAPPAWFEGLEARGCSIYR